MARAEKSASRLCLSRYARHSGGGGSRPSGRARGRSAGSCRTEYELQGGAMKTASNSPAPMRCSNGSPTSARSTSDHLAAGLPKQPWQIGLCLARPGEQNQDPQGRREAPRPLSRAHTSRCHLRSCRL
eukprot:820258-Prymnesium_polylepis.1